MRTFVCKKHLVRYSGLPLLLALLWAALPSAYAQHFSALPYIEPDYSSAVVGYAQASFDDYASNASDLNFRFEQQLTHNMYVTAQYYNFSEPQADFSFAAEVEDIQLGLGYMERSELGPHADTTFILGRETFQRPLPDAPNMMMTDESNYFGLQVGLREINGPLEVQAALAYVVHDGDRNTQLRWHVGAYVTVWQHLSIGLRYQDNEDYSVRSLELRYTW